VRVGRLGKPDTDDFGTRDRDPFVDGVRDRALFWPSCGNLHVRHALVGDDPPVTHPDDPVAGGANLLVVRDDEHGLPALTVEATEQAQDFRGPG